MKEDHRAAVSSLGACEHERLIIGSVEFGNGNGDYSTETFFSTECGRGSTTVFSLLRA